MAMLTLANIHVTMGDRHLLQGVSLVVNEGDRIGLLGPNGSGKSTLLRILAAELVPDLGDRTVRRDLRLGFLPQEPVLPDDAIAHEVVVRGIVGRDEVIRQLDEVHSELASPDVEPARLDKLLHKQQSLDERLESLGGHDVDHRADAVLDGLGVRDPRARCGQMSGGEKRRVALAHLLVGGPELLLLDEPTNHLDAQVTEWLEDYLRASGTPLVMVTHDRYFLDRLVIRTIELDQGHLHDYEGGYHAYVVKRAERLEHEASAESARLNTLRRETEWMKRGPPARTTKAKARIGRWQSLVDAAPPPDASELEFSIPNGPRLGDFVLRVRGLGVSFDGRQVLKPFDLEVGAGERIGIVGPNGAGKTTLLRSCLGQLTPTEGEVAVGPTVRYAGIDQARSELDPRKTVLEEVSNGNDYVFLGGRDMRVETFLEQFLFPGPMKHALVSTLSGGERNRVLLARMLCEGGNVLVLDEPTNDLDLGSLRALEDALQAFQGAVLVVSHDRWFLDRVATRIIHLDGSGKVRLHAGDLSMLLEKLASEADAAATAQKAKRKSTPRPPVRKARKLGSRDRQELADLPGKITAAEEQLQAVDTLFANPELYAAADRARIDELTAQRKQLPGEIEALYARWEELETMDEQGRDG